VPRRRAWCEERAWSPVVYSDPVEARREFTRTILPRTRIDFAQQRSLQHGPLDGDWARITALPAISLRVLLMLRSLL
jgi:hypothetical protein